MEEKESLFSMIWDAIRESFEVKYGHYPNLDLNGAALERLRVCVIAAGIALIIASAFACFRRNVFGGFVQRINAEAAWSPESAKTLRELGYEKNPAIRTALKTGRVYGGLVHCVAQDAFLEDREKAAAQRREDEELGKPVPKKLPKYQFDFENDRFFIPEKDSIGAESRFEKKKARLLPLILVMLGTVLAVIAVLYFLPDIVQLLDNFVGMLSGSAL